MPRPILDERVTIRLPGALLADCLDRVSGMKFPSLNEFILNSLENELARLGTYRLDYYNELRGLLSARQGDNVRHCAPLSAKAPL